MSRLDDLNATARSAGVDDLATVRAGLIELRDAAFGRMPESIDELLRLTHAIWWLSICSELYADES